MIWDNPDSNKKVNKIQDPVIMSPKNLSHMQPFQIKSSQDLKLKISQKKYQVLVLIKWKCQNQNKRQK